MEIVTSQFFRLLGWLVSEGDKNLPFASSFKALGVEIDCSRWQSGWVLFCNTQKRIDELQSTIAQAIQCGRLSAKNALVLRGRMQFARVQIRGRSAKLCLSAVTAHAYSDSGDSLSEHAIACLQAFMDSLVAARPREITAMWDKPMLLFTDASFTPDDSHWPCGLGGVLCNETGKQLAAISISLTEVDLKHSGVPLEVHSYFRSRIACTGALCEALEKVIMQSPLCHVRWQQWHQGCSDKRQCKILAGVLLSISFTQAGRCCLSDCLVCKGSVLEQCCWGPVPKFFSRHPCKISVSRFSEAPFK